MIRSAAAFALFAGMLSGCAGGCPDDFFRACAKPGCVEKVKALLAKDASLLSRADGRGWPGLHLAADRDIAEALLAAGADIEMRSAFNQSTPLWAAVERDHGDVVALLLAKGAKWSDMGDLLRTAAKDGRANAIEALVDSGVPVDSAESATQATPLHVAVLNDRLAAAETLLKKGANANAALSANAQVMSMAGASGNFKTGVSGAEAATPLKLARSDAMRELLKKNGAR